MPKTCSIIPAISIELWLLTDTGQQVISCCHSTAQVKMTIKSMVPMSGIWYVSGGYVAELAVLLHIASYIILAVVCVQRGRAGAAASVAGHRTDWVETKSCSGTPASDTRWGPATPGTGAAVDAAAADGSYRWTGESSVNCRLMWACESMHCSCQLSCMWL